MRTPFREQRWPAGRGGGKFQNRWGKVSEKLPTRRGNVSEKSHMPRQLKQAVNFYEAKALEVLS